MGTVWRAHDDVLDREVALKEVHLPPGLSESERQDSFRRLLREARLGARLHHAGIVPVHDVLTADDRPWIVMDLLSGRSLEGVIKEDGPLPPDLVARIGLALLAALEVAHEAGILHRDVKPANVIVDSRGNPTLTDFGIAFEMNKSSTTATGHVIGSPAYIAPERVRGETAGPPSDLYSLGATLYTAVEGRPPYTRDGQLVTMAAAVTEDPDPMRLAGWLTPILLGLLDKDPRRRWNADRCRRAFESHGQDGVDGGSVGGAMPTTMSPYPTLPDGRTPGAPRPSDAAPAGWAPTGPPPPTPYPSGQYPSGQYGSGQYPSDQYGAAPLSPAPQSSVPQSPGPYPSGPYPAPYQAVPPYRPPAPRRRRRWIGRTIGLTIVAVLVAADIGVGSHVPGWVQSLGNIASGTGLQSFFVESPPVPVADPKSTDVFAIGYSSGVSGQTMSVRRLNPTDGSTVWTGDSLGEIDPYAVVVAANPVSVAVSKTTVQAFNPATGKVLWTQTLSADLAGYGQNVCAAIVGNHVVVLSKDGNVQAFDLTSGTPTWHKQLSSTPTYLHVANGTVAVDDTVTGDSYGQTLLFFNPATGAATRLEPKCQHFPGQVRPQDDDWFFSADGNSVMVMFGVNADCVQGYNTHSLRKIWEHQPQPVIEAAGPDDVIGRLGGVQWDAADQLFTADPTSGNIQSLVSRKNVKFLPRGIVNGVAMIEVAPTYDSSKPTLLAVDAKTKKVLWEQPSRNHKTEDAQLAGFSAGNVLVVSCSGSESGGGPCKYDLLNPRTGATITSSTGTAGSSSPRLASITGNGQFTYILDKDGHLVTLDAKTAAVKSSIGGR
ncbi:hypothetical protein GCM10009765_27180 [Fodinicola feengrottensis]|uniref:non-specific serine/threonine protein kinase n=2 Tax=Fodinicola feengrottensis TaxID=435914 RepID=A0ABN2GT27_9ACTN